jgi:hypothetical protein
MNPVVLHFQLSRAEVIGTLRRRLLHTGRLWVGALVGACGIGLGAILLAQNAPARVVVIEGTVLITVGALDLTVFLFAMLVAPMQAWESNPSVRSPQSVAVSDYGVQARSVYTESTSQWPVFSQALEERSAYLLRMGAGRRYVILPKRAFSSASDELAFRALVQRYTKAQLHPRSLQGVPLQQNWPPQQNWRPPT